MKKHLLKPAVALSLALGLTVFLYWPIYQKISLTNSESNIDDKVKKLDLLLGDEIKEILDRKIDLPPNRHELCLENKNRVYLVHADSNTPGIPFLFVTGDISREGYALENKAGAMAIYLYYQNNLSGDENYGEIGQPKKCIVLDTAKLRGYASSTVVYHHIGLNRMEEFDLGGQGTLRILRSIVGGSLVDTVNSSAYIIARWKFFLLTLGTLFGIFFLLVNLVLKNY